MFSQNSIFHSHTQTLVASLLQFSLFLIHVSVISSMCHLNTSNTDINSQYQYQIIANDPENNQLIYSLTTAPSGMVIDASTGLITWNNPTLGNTNIKITATDTSGAIAVQEYTLTGKQNHAPVINSTPINQVILGNTYRYDVIATDAENDALTYTLDNVSKLAGVSID